MTELNTFFLQRPANTFGSLLWDDDDLHIDLAHLAQFSGARLIVSACTGIDADGQKLLFDDRPPLHFDILSINIGGQPDLGAIKARLIM